MSQLNNQMKEDKTTDHSFLLFTFLVSVDSSESRFLFRFDSRERDVILFMLYDQ